MFHCPAVPQSGRESKSIYVIEIVVLFHEGTLSVA